MAGLGFGGHGRRFKRKPVNPALCPQLYAALGQTSQTLASVRRPFSRPGPAAGRGAPLRDGKTPTEDP